MSRPLLVWPVVLIPSAADNPFARPRAGGTLTNGAHHLLVSRRAAQIDALHAGAEAGEVPVRVLQARDDGRAGDIDHASGRPTQCQDVGIGADACDPIATDGDRFSGRPTRDAGVDARV